jgi:hypothetical protein
LNKSGDIAEALQTPFETIPQRWHWETCRLWDSRGNGVMMLQEQKFEIDFNIEHHYALSVCLRFAIIYQRKRKHHEHNRDNPA